VFVSFFQYYAKRLAGKNISEMFTFHDLYLYEVTPKKYFGSTRGISTGSVQFLLSYKMMNTCTW